MSRVARALPLLLVLLGSAPAPVRAQEGNTVLTPKQRERERKGMTAFAAGRYQEALDLYAELYADFHDPIYLRNIGRCHYKLRHPEEAIAAFEEYEAQYKHMTSDELAQIDDWIRDMKELQHPTPSVAQPLPDTPPPAPPPAAVVAPPPRPIVAATPPPVRASAPTLQLRQPAPPADSNATVRHAGWGAIAVGAALAVAGGVFAASSWSKYDGAKGGACLMTNEGCSKAADTIEQRSTLSKGFFIGGAILAATGGALVLFFPPRPAARASTIAAGAAWVF